MTTGLMNEEEFEIKQELEALEKEIKSAENEDAQMEGRIKSNLERLNEDFGAKELKAAKKMLGKERQELEDMEIELGAKFKTLKETYEW